MGRFKEWKWEKRVLKDLLSIRRFYLKLFPKSLPGLYKRLAFCFGFFCLLLVIAILWLGKKNPIGKVPAHQEKIREVKIQADTRKCICEY